MKVSPKIKTLVVMVLSGAALYVGVLNLVDRNLWLQATDGIDWIQGQRGVEARTIFPRASAQTRAKIRPGIVLLGVNGLRVETVDDLTEIREILAQDPDREASYLVQYPNGDEGTVDVRMAIGSGLASVDWLLSVVAFGFLMAGLFIFVRSWNVPGALHFYFICLTAFTLLAFRHSGRADVFDVFIYWADAVALLLLPPLFVHYCFTFPNLLQRIRRPRLMIGFSYLPATFLLAIFGLWFVGALDRVGLARNNTFLAFFDHIHLLHFMALLCVGAGVLIVRQRWANTAERQQLKWITYGTVAGILPFLIFYGLPFLGGLKMNSWMEVSILSLLLVPLSFVYAITRYRLMDVDLIFRQSLAYALSSSALVGLYVGTTLLIGRAFEGVAGQSEFGVFAVAALVVAFLFAPLKNTLQEQIDRYFYRDRYDYRSSLTRFGRELSSHATVPVLVERLSQRLQKTLGVEPVEVFVRTRTEALEFELYKDLEVSSQALPRLILDDSTMASLEHDPGWLKRISGEGLVDPNHRILNELGLLYVQPLKIRDRIIGLLCFGSRKDGQPTSSADLSLVQTLADYAAIAFDNALLYQSLESNAAELSELKAYSENVIESITVGVCVVDADGFVKTWNSAMSSLYGMSSAEVSDRSINKVFPGNFVRVLENLRGGKDWAVAAQSRLQKTHLQCADGKTCMLSVIVAPFISTSNMMTGALLIFEDITRKIQLENQLLQAEKLSSIGLFAAGIAHEVNTPLAGISSYAQILLKEAREDAPNREILRKIEAQSFRASEIINNLLNFARVSESDVKSVKLNSLMNETFSLLEHSFKAANIDVDIELDASLPATIGNGSRLQQVFMNLFVNARDAMPEGGRLSVRTAARNSQLVVEIRDTGEGISPEAIQQIYDPFFTTKPVGKGTGLGLAVSYGIVQEHSGRIAVDSRPGEGTTFTIHLPLKRLN